MHVLFVEEFFTTLYNVKNLYLEKCLQEKNSVALELETDGYGIHLCAQVPNPDIVVVPGGMGTDALMGDKTILQWLCKVFQFQYPCRNLLMCSSSP